MKDEPILCCECYEKYHNMKIDDSSKYAFIALVKCEFCEDQPTIWFRFSDCGRGD